MFVDDDLIFSFAFTTSSPLDYSSKHHFTVTNCEGCVETFYVGQMIVGNP